MNRPAPLGRTWAGVCIDDLATMQKSKKTDDSDTTVPRDTEIMCAADKIYDEVGLPEKAEKRQRNLPGGRAWGAYLDQHVSAGETKTLELVWVSLAFLATGTVTRKQVEKLVGHWNFPLQFRRLLFATF